jgi:hypothetical protein
VSKKEKTLLLFDASTRMMCHDERDLTGLLTSPRAAATAKRDAVMSLEFSQEIGGVAKLRPGTS